MAIGKLKNWVRHSE